MSLSRLSTSATLPLSTWTQIDKTSSGTPSTPLPFAAAPAVAVPVTSVTSSGTTATVTTAAVHNLKTGDLAVISNAALANYNGTFAVTVTSTTTFTYVMAGSATSPAVGAQMAPLVYFATTYPACPVTGNVPTSITSSSGVATVTTPTPHGLKIGDIIKVNGASVSGYNGVFNVATVPSSTTFTYSVASGIASPAISRTRLIMFAPALVRPSRVILRADASNTADITIGPNSSANFDAVSAGTDYEIPGDQDTLDLAAWYFASTAASQLLHILFV